MSDNSNTLLVTSIPNTFSDESLRSDFNAMKAKKVTVKDDKYSLNCKIAYVQFHSFEDMKQAENAIKVNKKYGNGVKVKIIPRGNKIQSSSKTSKSKQSFEFKHEQPLCSPPLVPQLIIPQKPPELPQQVEVRQKPVTPVIPTTNKVEINVKTLVVGLNQDYYSAEVLFNMFKGYLGIINYKDNIYLLHFNNVEGPKDLITYCDENSYLCEIVSDKTISNVFSVTHFN